MRKSRGRRKGAPIMMYGLSRIYCSTATPKWKYFTRLFGQILEDASGGDRVVIRVHFFRNFHKLATAQRQCNLVFHGIPELSCAISAWSETF